MTRRQYYTWRDAPQPVNPADEKFIKNLMLSVRRKYEEATNRKAAPTTQPGHPAPPKGEHQ